MRKVVLLSALLLWVGVGAVAAQSTAAAKAAYERGEAAYRADEYDKAIREFSEAIRLDPRCESCYANRALAYEYGRQDYDKCIADFTEAIRLDGGKSTRFEFRGDCYKLKGNYAKAIADYESALRIAPNDEDVPGKLAEARKKAAGGGGSGYASGGGAKDIRKEYKPLLSKIRNNANINYDGGGKYKGMLQNGEPNGLGIYSWPNGDYYFGGWSDSKKDGGTMYLSGEESEHLYCSGCVVWVGDYSNDKKSGKGTCYNKSGDLIYYGDFSNGKPTETYPSTGGFSNYKFQALDMEDGDYYIGETKDGKREGWGAFVWPSGTVWFGKWKGGGRGGKGLYTKSDGSWELQECAGDDCKTLSSSDKAQASSSGGNAKNIQKEIKPVLSKVMNNVDQSWNNGDKYKGGMYSGKRHGWGIYSWSDGSYYLGGYESNWRSGYGIMLQPDGKEMRNCSNCAFYVGNFRVDDKSGKGTCYDKYGNLIYYGDFSGDKPTGTYPTAGSYSNYKFIVGEAGDDYYIGEMKDGKRSGWGAYVWKNGDIWYGSWKDGNRGGDGMYTLYGGKWYLQNCDASDCTTKQSSESVSVSSSGGGGSGGGYSAPTEYRVTCPVCNGIRLRKCTWCNGTKVWYGRKCEACSPLGLISCNVCDVNGTVSSNDPSLFGGGGGGGGYSGGGFSGGGINVGGASSSDCDSYRRQYDNANNAAHSNADDYARRSGSVRAQDVTGHASTGDRRLANLSRRSADEFRREAQDVARRARQAGCPGF